MNIKAMPALKTYKNDSILLTPSAFCLYSSPGPSVFVTNDIPFTSATIGSKQMLQNIFHFTVLCTSRFFLPTSQSSLSCSVFVVHLFNFIKKIQNFINIFLLKQHLRKQFKDSCSLKHCRNSCSFPHKDASAFSVIFLKP